MQNKNIIERMNNKYLYIFLHIPKTAGSTLNYHIKRNLGNESLYLNHRALGFYQNNTPASFSEYDKLTKKYIDELSKDTISKLKVIYGHFVPYGIHKYFKRPARYFTFFRDPVSRTVSLYNFKRSNYKRIRDLDNLKIFYRRTFLVNNKIPSFSSWLENKFANKDHQGEIVSMTDSLRRLGYLDNTNNLEGLFNKFYFIGITSNFDNDALYLYKKLGIKKYYKNRNISKKYFTLKNKSPLRNKILKKCEGDQKLFMEAREINKKYRETYEYKKIIVKKKIERAITLPFTQYLFQPVQTARSLKHKIFYLKKGSRKLS